MVEIFEEKGVSTKDATMIMETLSKYPKVFVDAMMHFELEMDVPDEDENPWCVRCVCVYCYFSFIPFFFFRVSLLLVVID